MRKVTYGGAISLDGFLAGPNEEIDWLRYSDDVAEIMKESFRGVDAMLMGRKTFDFAQRMGGGPPMKGVTTYVFSRTMTEMPDGADGELVSEDVADFVRRIKGEEGGDILVMGGGELGTALIDAGLVDEIGFSIQPVLLGGGIPAFRELSTRVELELIEARPIEPGCVLLRYRVVNRA
ncbi:dihydrofolate reductase family protein [Sphingomonas sp. RG327]|jgi:dihydrofolate reductase|uniref:Dihydrofolate reductase family protein n=1 Tax=Sphingomonas anseongensis TaxID=2908207 RepID=A0ABT0RBS6_9SPHN|nr:dihydrofolate reductase family protein [Sphingomonas anseongensis]MCL6677711.1 dihydrofolate reductase family protein [Sphingomonas anseongensis]